MSEGNKEGLMEASHQAQADFISLPEAIPDEGNVRHISVLFDGDTAAIQKCTDSDLFHCPFCQYVGEKWMVDNHIKGHSSVKHKGYRMMKCGLGCRTATHFHCCYCAATIINRLQFTRHLKIHLEEEHAAAPAQHFVDPVQQFLAPAHSPSTPTQHPEAPAQASAQASAQAPAQAPAQHPKAPAQAPAQHPEVPAEAPAQHPLAPKTRNGQKKFICPHCKVILNKRNFKTHCRRKHTRLFETAWKDRFLAWTKDQTAQFICLRGELGHLFTGSKNSASVAWCTILERMDLQEHVTPLQAQKKWDNLKKKYKDCKCPGSGDGVIGKPTAATWPWYVLMDEVVGQMHPIAPPALIASIPEDRPGRSSAVGEVKDGGDRVEEEDEDDDVEEEEEEEEEEDPDRPEPPRRQQKRKRDREGELIDLLREHMRRRREAEERNERRMERILSILERCVPIR